jgi:non-specific serine/threonine protein kinase
LIVEREAQARAERTRRLMERTQARRVGFAIALVTLVAGLIVSTTLYFQAREAQHRAEQAVATTRAVSGFLSKDLFGSIDLSKRPVRDLTVEEVVNAGAAQIDSRFRDAPDVAAEIHAALGASYMALELPEADYQLNRALELYESTKGIGSSEGLTILAELLGFHHTPDQTNSLVTHAEKALAAGRQQYGETNEAVLQLRFKSALGQFQRGDWVREVQELQSISADMDRYFPNTSHFDGQLSRSLGSGLFNVAEFASAEQWLVRARSEVGRASKESVGSAPMVHMDLGALYRETGRFAEAELELSTALASMQRLVPDNSAYVLQIRRNQGQLKLEEGRLVEASAILQDVIGVLASSPHDTDREGSWLMRYYLGLAYQAQGHEGEAAEMLRGSLERCEAAKGLDYPLAEQIRIGLAETLRLQGKLDEAQALLTRVDLSGLPGLPKDHPIVGELRRSQGLLLKQRGQIETSRAALTEALRVFTIRYGKTHWRTRRGQDDLAQLR